MDKDKVCYLKNPWSGAMSTMTWGEVVGWCALHVHQADRTRWIRAAWEAARSEDADTLGKMIIGA